MKSHDHLSIDVETAFDILPFTVKQNKTKTPKIEEWEAASH